MPTGTDSLVDIKRAFYPPNFRFPIHDHDFEEIALVLDGCGWHDSDNSKQRLGAGDLIIVDQQAHHRLRADRQQSLSFINLVLSPMLTTALRTAGLWQCSSPILLQLRPDDRIAIQERITDLERPGGSTDRIALQALLADLMWRIDRSTRRLETQGGPLARALQALDGPDGLVLGAAALADIAACSREHLNRLVRRHQGCTLVELITGRRLDHAARLLRHSDDSISDIAAACAYRSLGHFYARFAERFGQTPAAWRKSGYVSPA